MPLPDYMPTESSPTKKTPKKKGSAPAGAGYGGLLGGAGATSGFDWLTGASTGAVEAAYNSLAAQPLPTQGAVADLVEKSSNSWMPSWLGSGMDKKKQQEEKAAKKIEANLLPPMPDPIIWKTITEQVYKPNPMPLPGSTVADEYHDETRVVPVRNPAYDEWVRLGHRQERKSVLAEGAAPQEPGAKDNNFQDVHRLTSEAYNALKPRAKAAVDFNTALVNAARKDRRLNRTGAYEDVTDEQLAAYNENLTEALGQGRGSKLYAPETLALVNQLKITDPKADLDDFLKLRVAVTDDMIKYVDKTTPRNLPETEILPGVQAIPALPGLGDTIQKTEFPGLSITEEQRLALANDLINSTLNLEQHLVDSGQMIQTFLASTRNERNEFLSQWGGVENKVELAGGFGQLSESDVDENGFPVTDNAIIQMAYQKVAEKKIDIGATLARLKRDKPELVEPLLHYVDMMTQKAESGVPLAGPKSYTPEELRKQLKLGG